MQTQKTKKQMYYQKQLKLAVYWPYAATPRPFLVKMISLLTKANKLAQNNDLIPQQRHINASVRLNYTERITAIAGQISESHSRRLTQRDREKTGKKQQLMRLTC